MKATKPHSHEGRVGSAHQCFRNIVSLIDMYKSKLMATLIECERLLSQAGEKHWAEKIRHVVQGQVIREHEINEIQSWFGGMGSFNDVILCSRNGHTVDAMDELGVNAQLQSLQGEIYEISRQAQRQIMLDQ